MCQDLFILQNRPVTYRELRLPLEGEEIMSRVKRIRKAIYTAEEFVFWTAVAIVIQIAGVYHQCKRKDVETNTNNNNVTQ